MTEKKKKFTVTVSKISTFQVEARDREHAEELAQELLDMQDEEIEKSIDLGDSGWEVTDVEES